ncbi:MAG: UDP-N-acetylmuramate--L-alanine ligase [Flavobacteriales bacterium]|nr:UDP-N-acetylmuramate--L-alanine ligase [Flavobacteriales bacterium]
MELNNIHKVYFIGIGGIGMSALAKFFAAKGISVSGYDKTPSLLTDNLSSLGIDITFDDAVSAIDADVLENKKTLVVYTPAIQSTNKILKYFKDSTYHLLKRSEVLGIISRNTFCLAVAGTHGKTTTSALLGHIMAECNTGASSFIGGIVSKYNSNLIIGDKDIMVVEADEYDRSFLTLSPDIACITSMDADHLDIYGDVKQLEDTFFEFLDRLSHKGVLISKTELGIGRGLTYSINVKSDYFATGINVRESKFNFDIVNPEGLVFSNVKSNLPGKYNIENTLAAFAMAEQYGLDGRDIVKAIESFTGVYRRFDVFEYSGKTIVDDYAHHPFEIISALDAARELYVGKKIMVIFQPHLYSRTRDFAKDFANALAEFDEIRLLDIYAARELPIEGVTSITLLKTIQSKYKSFINKDEIREEIDNTKCEVIMMLGAGDISIEIEKLKK